ncbi:MAG: NUDIX domain-containing protein [bacterium]|nr:NUDIX domain-containing protein [bacterium]
MAHSLLVPSVYALLTRSNATEILLLCRQNTGYCDGEYGLVAGHGEKYEHPIEALLREMKEEAGISVTREHVQFVHVMSRYSFKDERVDFFFHVPSWSGEVVNREPDKCRDLSWFPLTDLPGNTIPYIRQAIACWQEQLFYSEFSER